MTQRFYCLLIALTVANTVLAGCGQRGPLTLREPPPAEAAAEPVQDGDVEEDSDGEPR